MSEQASKRASEQEKSQAEVMETGELDSLSSYCKSKRRQLTSSLCGFSASSSSSSSSLPSFAFPSASASCRFPFVFLLASESVL